MDLATTKANAFIVLGRFSICDDGVFVVVVCCVLCVVCCVPFAADVIIATSYIEYRSDVYFQLSTVQRRSVVGSGIDVQRADEI